MEATAHLTAIRTRKGSKSIVTVYRDGVEFATLGGKRAERAAAAIVSDYWTVLVNRDGYSAERAEQYRYSVELRGDLAKAQVEAHRNATRTSIRIRGGTFPCTPADSSVAVPVTEQIEEQSSTTSAATVAADDSNTKGLTMMADEMTLHVEGSTRDEINASFERAKAHYTKPGADRPTKGVMNRLYRESKAAFAALAEPVPAAHQNATVEAAVSMLKDELESPEFAAALDETDRILAEEVSRGTARSAAGAKAQAEAEKANASRARSNRVAVAERQAADRVAVAISEAVARTADPYATAMANRRLAGDKRGAGVKVSEPELEGYIRRLVKDHPEYKVGQVWECCRWTAKLAISKDRFNTAWKAVTGADPVYRAMNRKAS